jgi:hypothetical protein
MRPIIPELLWIGNALDLRDVRGVLSLGIRAVIDLAANEPPVQYPRDIAYCRFPLSDGTENDPAILRLAVHSTAEFVKARMPTLVACSAGMSRSPAIVAAALALVEGKPPDDVLRRIASSGPHDVAPGLWFDVKRAAFSSDACSTTDHVVNWSEMVRLSFGDVTGPARLASWSDVKARYPIGSKISGRVVLKAPFGVWLDVGVGFPALILVTRFKTLLTYDEYVASGPRPGGHLDASVYLFNENARCLVLTQRPHDETI